MTYEEAVNKLQRTKLKMGDQKHIDMLALFNKTKRRSTMQKYHKELFINLMSNFDRG